MDERQRMWWEAACAAMGGLCAIRDDEWDQDKDLPDLVKQAGLFADHALAEYDRRFPTPHPAPAAATGEGEVRMFLAVDAVGSDVHVQTSEAEGWVVACADEDSALFLEDKLRVFVHRPEAAALLAPRKPEAEGADTSIPPATGIVPVQLNPVTGRFICDGCGHDIVLSGSSWQHNPEATNPAVFCNDARPALAPTPPAPGLREAAEQAARRLVREMTWGWPESEGMEELTPDQERHVTALANAFVDFAALAATPAQTAGVLIRPETAEAMKGLLRMWGDEEGWWAEEFRKHWRVVVSDPALTPTTAPAGEVERD